MSHVLPFDVLELIAEYTDIDSRRAMGFLPRKLCFDVLRHMDLMIERKYNAMYKGYEDQVTTFFVISKVNDLVSGMYIQHKYKNNYVLITHTTGHLSIGSKSDHYIYRYFYFDTEGIVRSTNYHTFGAFEPTQMSTVSTNGGVCGLMTPYNFECIRECIRE